MRVAINLLTDDPDNPSGAHWFWTRVIPEMAKDSTEGEELHLLVSPTLRRSHQGYGPRVRYITFPWSNERRNLRTLSEHVTRRSGCHCRIDVFSTLIAPIIKPAPVARRALQDDARVHGSRGDRPPAALYRRIGYPRTATVADAIIINSESLRAEVEKHLDVDPAKLRLIPEAVDHELFRPGDRDEAARTARGTLRRRPAVRPVRLLAVALQELRRAPAGLRGRQDRARRPPARRRGARRDTEYAAGFDRWPRSWVSPRTSSGSAGCRSRRRSPSTVPRTSSCTPPTTRRSA